MSKPSVTKSWATGRPKLPVPVPVRPAEPSKPAEASETPRPAELTETKRGLGERGALP
jgi:hypothetical protein